LAGEKFEDLNYEIAFKSAEDLLNLQTDVKHTNKGKRGKVVLVLN
jgi:hypothetical protein